MMESMVHLQPLQTPGFNCRMFNSFPWTSLCQILLSLQQNLVILSYQRSQMARIILTPCDTQGHEFPQVAQKPALLTQPSMAKVFSQSPETGTGEQNIGVMAQWWEHYWEDRERLFQKAKVHNPLCLLQQEGISRICWTWNNSPIPYASMWRALVERRELKRGK